MDLLPRLTNRFHALLMLHPDFVSLAVDITEVEQSGAKHRSRCSTFAELAPSDGAGF